MDRLYRSERRSRIAKCFVDHTKMMASSIPIHVFHELWSVHCLAPYIPPIGLRYLPKRPEALQELRQHHRIVPTLYAFYRDSDRANNLPNRRTLLSPVRSRTRISRASDHRSVLEATSPGEARSCVLSREFASASIENSRPHVSRMMYGQQQISEGRRNDGIVTPLMSIHDGSIA